jgi:p-hydroxybenzoate 3-monooxygenase
MAGTLSEDTAVVIVGGGVSGLTAGSLLRRCGVPCVVLERQSRAYVEKRQRAGVVESRAVRMFENWGLGHVLGAFPADGTFEFRVDGETRLLDEPDPLGDGATGRLCPQQVLVRNLIAAFLADGGDLRFEAADVMLHKVADDQPVVTYRDQDGAQHEIRCAFVAGCDGDLGISRASMPGTVISKYSMDYGISWLTVLADAPAPRYPMFAMSENGFAAQFERGPRASRFYLACPADDKVDNWPSDRIWRELRARLGRDDLPDGPITEREMFPLRSVVHEPMSYGRLYLLGDAAHIVPPVGGKGMNLAIFDAEVFACAVRDFTRDGDDKGLRAYSPTCLARIWNYQEWISWQTEMLHGMSGEGRTDPFRARLAKARLDRLLGSATARRLHAELSTGLA